MEVDVAGTMLVEDVLGNDGTQFHRILALVEVPLHLFARDPEHTAGHHRLPLPLAELLQRHEVNTLIAENPD